MMRRNAVAVVLVLLPSLSVQAAPHAPLTSQQLAGIRLGMPRADVWQHLGKPNESDLFRLTGYSYVGDYWQSNQKIDEVISQQGKVVQIQRDLYHGNSERVTFLSIRRDHPHLEIKLYDHGGDVGSDLILDDVQQGIAWRIYIWHDEFTYLKSYRDCVANWVIIHAPGRSALPNPGQRPIKDALLLHNLHTWFTAKRPKATTHKGD